MTQFEIEAVGFRVVIDQPADTLFALDGHHGEHRLHLASTVLGAGTGARDIENDGWCDFIGAESRDRSRRR